MECSFSRPVGQDYHSYITQLKINSGINAEYSFGPIGGVRNNSEAIGSSDKPRDTFDSDGDAITVTPPSSSSLDASSGIDKLEYVDDDYDQNNFQGVRLGEPLRDRERGDSSASCFMDQHGGVNGDDDSSNLYNATPSLRPQNQYAFSFGEPLSLCISCSSTHAESIPTAKRSPARVPITPTSPTAYAEDADTEWPAVERKRKSRSSAMLDPQIPQPKTSRLSPRSDTNIPLFRTNPNNLSDHEANRKTSNFHLAAHALERRARTAAPARPSGKPNSTHAPVSAPILRTPDTWEAELCLRSREAENSGYTASGNEGASNGSLMHNRRFRPSRRGGLTATKHRLRIRTGTPYPFVFGEQLRGGEGILATRP